MGTNRLLIWIFLVSLISCQQQKSKQTDANETMKDSVISKPESVKTIEKKMTINDKTIDWSKFDKVYAYLDPENEFKQILGVKWYGIDSIDYQLICSSILCDTEIQGTARANHLGGDMEIDEDENGGYPVNEYIFETKDYVVSVRIDLEEKSKARMIYSPNREADECDPDNELIMKITNTNS